jgi:hypothetical protein
MTENVLFFWSVTSFGLMGLRPMSPAGVLTALDRGVAGHGGKDHGGRFILLIHVVGK